MSAAPPPASAELPRSSPYSPPSYLPQSQPLLQPESAHFHQDHNASGNFNGRTAEYYQKEPTTTYSNAGEAPGDPYYQARAANAGYNLEAGRPQQPVYYSPLPVQTAAQIRQDRSRWEAYWRKRVFVSLLALVLIVVIGVAIRFGIYASRNNNNNDNGEY